LESTSNTGEHKHEERMNHQNNNQEFKTETKMNTKGNHKFNTTPKEYTPRATIENKPR